MAVVYNRRTSAPSNTNKYYLKYGKTYNGYNKCILINSSTGSCLPNCTGYAWGRYCEAQGIHSCKLSTGDAGNWWYKQDGYKRGQTPKLGAVICWSKINGAGHVAIVEKIEDNGDITTSNSAYNGSYFFLDELKKSNNYYFGKNYVFQGFIYPDTEFIDPDTPIPPEEQKNYKTKFPWFLYSRKIKSKHLTVN